MVVIIVINVHVVVIDIAGVDPRNLPIKIGLNQVINRWDVVDVVVIDIVVVVVVVA